MLKQFAIIFSISLFICSFAIAQEDPGKVKEETNKSSQVKTEQSADAVTNTTEAKVWNTVCPVKGNPVEEDSPTVEYNGKLYGFCCPGCDTKFAKNPEKYAKNLSEDGTKFIGRK
jgi:YHS domain-containing protein